MVRTPSFSLVRLRVGSGALGEDLQRAGFVRDGLDLRSASAVSTSSSDMRSDGLAAAVLVAVAPAATAPPATLSCWRDFRRVPDTSSSEEVRSLDTFRSGIVKRTR